jgi:hypothetical protein
MAGRIAAYDPHLVRKRLSNWPLFDPKLYRHLNPDLPDDDSGLTDHFANQGLWEERSFTKETRLVADLMGLGRPTAFDLDTPLAAISASKLLKMDLGVYVNSGSNFFMRELARLLSAGLRRLGLKVTEGDETTPHENRRKHTIVVAPHEFFLLGAGKAWARGDAVADAVMLSTEQPQTQWFIKSLPYLLSCRGILDLCWQTSAAFDAAGVPSSFYMPGMAEAPWTARIAGAEVLENVLVASLPQAALDFRATEGPLFARPLDVTFMASASPIRDDFFSRHLATLRELQMVLIYRRPSHGVPKGYAPDEHVTGVNDFILRRSKILLNVHRDALGYFEVHRIGMQGMWNGCAVVSNACLPHPYFVGNEHYFEETLDRIPKLIQWLIRTPEGREEAERVRAAALAQYAVVGNERMQSLRVANFIARCFDLEDTGR